MKCRTYYIYTQRDWANK